MTAFNPHNASGPLDPFLWTEARNFGAVSAKRPHTRYRTYANDTVEWQKSVYDLALEAHTDAAFDVILDIGCGDGRKSHSRFGESAGLLQVDRKDYRNASLRDLGTPFRAVSFDSWDDLQALFDSLDPSKKTLVICADVIEHLFDPRPLIAFIRNVMLQKAGNIAFVSTPDHERVDGARLGELPTNAEHVRQWSVFGLGSLFRSAGFTVEQYGLLPMNDYDKLGCAICAKLSCARDEYSSFLSQAGLPMPSARLYVTSEHKSLGRGGGIGTYAFHSDNLIFNSAIFLLFGGNGVPNEGVAAGKSRQILHVGDIMKVAGTQPAYVNGPRVAQELLDAVKTLIFFFPELRCIEYDDYLGHAHAIAQAKEASLLPTRLKTVCYCHGNHHYLEVNHSKFFFDHDLHRRERICAERADLTLIPSDFLSGIYRRAGFKPKQEVRLGYPYLFRFDEISDLDYKKIRRIVFFGKRTRGKGYHLFGAALNYLAEQGELDQVEEILIAGVGEDAFTFHPAIAGKVKNHLYPTQKLVETLHAERAETLAVLPYLGDNFPYSVHELLDAGVQTIFARAGGVPEVLAGCDTEDAVFFAPKPTALAKRLLEKLKQNGISRAGEVRSLRTRFKELQHSRNEAYRALMLDACKGATPLNLAVSELPAYDVVITFHDEEPRYLSDALASLASQSVMPANVVIVNDASSPERLREAEAVVAAQTDLRIKIVSPERNLGLSDARNFGCTFVESAFFIVHDVDNMLRADAAERMLTTLLSNPDVAAATCYNLMFPDHEDWLHRTETLAQFGWYEPTGPDLAEFETNTFGDALAMYRRSMVDAVGGWRNSGLEPLEDFELFYNLVAQGYYVAVIPAPVAMYRVREESMLRTYDRFGGFRRLADVVTRRLGRDGLSIVRHAMHAQKLSRAGMFTDQAPPPLKAKNENLHKLLMASLPSRLRSYRALRKEVIGGASWKVMALRNPLRIRYWQALRRLQLAAKRTGLRK